MAGHERPEPRAPGEPFRSATDIPALDLADALGALDDATRNFARRLGDGRPADELGPAHALPTAAAGPSCPPPVDEPAVPPAPTHGDTFEQRMREAEREAREYLEHAKRRADRLVRTMVGAVEREAAEMRREAEAAIDARRQEVEVDAQRHLGEARRIADSMVAERQERIAALSDVIIGRAHALTSGMDDADRIREQFDSFVRALSRTADRIAGRTAAIESAPARSAMRDDRDQPSPIAA